MTLEWSHLVPLPTQQRFWFGPVVADDLPTGALVEEIDRSMTETTTGWPLLLLEARLVVSGVPCQVRLAAFYTFGQHGAHALVRAETQEDLDTARPELQRILLEGRPDFRGPLVSIEQFLGAQVLPEHIPAHADARAAQLLERLMIDRPDSEALLTVLGELDALSEPGPLTIYARGRVLDALGQRDRALECFEEAAAKDPGLAEAHHARGLAYSDLGREGDALAAWEQAIASDPRHIDSRYNAGKARYRRKEFGVALAHWRTAGALAPDDFAIAQKILLAEHALDRDAADSRARLLDIRSRSGDPAIQEQESFVFDQFDVDGRQVLAHEPFPDAARTPADVYRFTVRGEADTVVKIETSELGRRKGTPFVVSLTYEGVSRTVGAMAALPPYPEIRELVRSLIRRP